jgi:hypothetical protein
LHAPPISGVRYLQSFTVKMAKRGGSVAKLASILRMYIPAGKATPSPPLGPALGQVRDLERMCQYFNIHDSILYIYIIPERG